MYFMLIGSLKGSPSCILPSSGNKGRMPDAYARQGGGLSPHSLTKRVRTLLSRPENLETPESDPES